MDDLLREFLTETSESLDTVDNQLVKFEQEPNNAKILDNIFRLVHTIKGTCGFLGLPRLEALAHAGETLMGKFRDGMPVTGPAVTLILSSIDRIKEILAGLEATEAEPEGNDRDLIDKLEAMVEQGMAAMAAGAAAPVAVAEAPPLVPEAPAAAAPAPAKDMTTGSLIDQTLERPLRPGESRSTISSAPSARPRSRRLRPSKQRPSPHRLPKSLLLLPRRRRPRRRPRRRSRWPTREPPKATASPTSRSASTWIRWSI